MKHEPARSGPGSLVELAVDEDCHPETYTVSKYLAICVTCTGSSLKCGVGPNVRVYSQLSHHVRKDDSFNLTHAP
jgi:hypothetical protein